MNSKKAKNADIIFGALSITGAVIAAAIYLLIAIGGVLINITPLKFLVGRANVGSAILFGFVLGTLWVVIGVKALLRAERSGRYGAVFKDFGNYPRIKFSEVVKKRNKTLKEVSADLKTMRKRGYFEGMEFDLVNKELVFSRNSEPLPKLDGEDDTVYAEKKSFPIFAMAAALINFIAFTMGQSVFIISSLIISTGVFFLLLYFFPAPVFFAEERAKIPVVKKPSATKNVQLDEMLNSIYEDKKELVRLMNVIGAAKIRKPLKEILRVLDEMSNYLTDNPDKIKNLRQFVNYYLPTTVSFLKTYEELDAKPDKGVNINATLRKIEDVTEKLTIVYKREYDELYSEKAMDVNADISVMKAIIDENK